MIATVGGCYRENYLGFFYIDFVSKNPRLSIFTEHPENQDSVFLMFTQFSILRSGTLLNSFTLLVTRTASKETACAAISKSIAPMTFPCCSSNVRITP